MISTFEFADNVVGILIKSKLDLKLIDEVHEEILKRAEQYKKINLYVEIEPGISVSISALIKNVAFKISKPRIYNKIALVSDIQWLQNVMEIKDLLMDAEIRNFRVESRLDAIQWITE